MKENKCKKIRKLFIFMATVLLAFAVGCQTGTDSDTSKESAEFTYEVTEEGTICITGLKDESVSELVIPKKIDGKQVTEIGRYAFYDCENLKSVELPSVEKIGKAAFSGCKNLESVSMPKIETIEGKAFLDCAKLTQVELPEEVEIADNAFDGCDSLTELPTSTATAGSTNDKQFKNAKVGDTVVFGSYEQDNNTSNGKEEIEWLVLEKTDDKVLVISKYGLDCQPYNEEREKVTWETCTLRNWLNDEFFNAAFTDKEQKMIPTVTVTAEDNPSWGTDAGNDTKDKVFLLSISEAKNYFVNAAARMCEPTAYAVEQGAYVNDDYSSSGSCWWWLRSPGDNQGSAAYVINVGYVNFDGYFVNCSLYAVRPALWINLNP